jgi:hypothetical protein
LSLFLSGIRGKIPEQTMLLFVEGLVVGMMLGILLTCGAIAWWMAQISATTEQELSDE